MRDKTIDGSDYSDNEREIVRLLRSLEAYERVEIVADKSGKPDYYLVIRTSKVLLTDNEPQSMK